MALKGTAVIELTNIKTGEKERYVEHNLITKALEYMHQPIGGLKLPQQCTVQTEVESYDWYAVPYTYLLGGLMLWDKAIEESDTIVTKPHGVKLVGCAAYAKVNTTTSPRRGSYNEAESYFTNSSTETSMKFVYDFTTSQANGIINCISLGNWKGGWNGFGGDDYMNDVMASNGPYNIYLGQHTYTNYWLNASKTSSPVPIIYVDPEEDVFYTVGSVSTTSVTIYKCRANLHMRSMFKDMYRDHAIVDSITIDLPQTLSAVGTFSCNYDADHDIAYIRVSPTSSTAASGTFYVIAVNMTSHEATVYTLKNPLTSSETFTRRNAVCYDGYMYYAGRYKIDLKTAGYTILTIPKGSYYNEFTEVINGLIYFMVSYSSGNSTYYRVAVLDPSTGEIEITGYRYYPSGSYSYGRGGLAPIKGHPLNFYYRYFNSSNNNYYYSGYIWLDTNYLATINNLARPIEKTSDKTMKITYTIQEM